ncbi:MAG: TolC family protein [Dysgonamonadaceae bacterium]|jgi:outer membrane protein TolC|nr:TolC family protein [Dysgonamonadaceae bacterium]
MKKVLLIIFLICSNFSLLIYGQLTIEDCYEKARENYPQIKQYKLIEQSKEYSLTNASRGYLPQLSLSLKATYQSEVTEIPISLPGVNIPTINHDQYQAVAEVNQMIWDGGAIKSQKKRIEAEHNVEEKQFEIDLYALRERIIDLFFGVLLFEEQLVLNDIYNNELKANQGKIIGSMQNGMANQSDLDIINVEILNTSQRKTELEALCKAYADMLAYFTGKLPEEGIRLIKPEVSFDNFEITGHESGNLRPEIAFYEANTSLLEVQKAGVSANNLPKISAFLQGGYGNPGLNMLKEGFRSYAIGGLKLNWNFGALYTRKNDLRKINNSIEKINTQKEVFHFNSRIKAIRQQNEADKYRTIIHDDIEIIKLRENIKKASEAKTENGIMTMNDLVRDISAVQMARQNKAIHEIEMMKSIYQLKNILNK